jgi:hypothetical protein
MVRAGRRLRMVAAGSYFLVGVWDQQVSTRRQESSLLVKGLTALREVWARLSARVCSAGSRARGTSTVVALATALAYAFRKQPLRLAGAALLAFTLGNGITRLYAHALGPRGLLARLVLLGTGGVLWANRTDLEVLVGNSRVAAWLTWFLDPDPVEEDR